MLRARLLLTSTRPPSPLPPPSSHPRPSLPSALLLPPPQDKGSNIHYGDHHLVLRVLESAGFVGGLGRKVARWEDGGACV